MNEYFDSIYQAVAQRFAHDTRVTIHRATSREVAQTISDGYFDAVYIDGDHRYEAVLEDLHLYNQKLADNGISLIDDFCEHGIFENAQYGVISAINKFMKRTGHRTLVVNNELYSFFSLVRSDRSEGKQLIQNMVDSEIYFMEINDGLAPNYHHKFLRKSDGSLRCIPGF